jgi:hypothetical protein
LKKQLETFSELYQKMGVHLRNAQQCYADGDRKLERTRITVDELAMCAPVESEVPELFEPARVLGLRD